MPDLVAFLLSHYAVQVPVLLVWLVGLIVALAHLGRHGRIARITVLALLILIARTLVVPLIQVWIQNNTPQVGQLGFRLAVLNVAAALVGAVAWMLVLMAVFGDRVERPAPSE